MPLQQSDDRGQCCHDGIHAAVVLVLVEPPLDSDAWPPVALLPEQPKQPSRSGKGVRAPQASADATSTAMTGRSLLVLGLRVVATIIFGLEVG